MEKWIPIDQVFAEIGRRQEGEITTKEDALMDRVKRLKGEKIMVEETCKVEGCEEERVGKRAVCRRHYNEQQKKYSEGRKRSSGERKPAGKALPRKSDKEAAPPPEKKQCTFRIGLEDLLDIVGRLKAFRTEEEARAYLLGFFAAREQ